MVCAKKKEKEKCICKHRSMQILCLWFSLSFYLNDVKREIDSLIVYKWPLQLQIAVTVLYVILRLLGNSKHKLHLFKACPRYPYTQLKPSKKSTSVPVITDKY